VSVHKDQFSRFLSANPGRLHFAAHSHHPWPDVTRQAVLEAWDDAARLIDRKWERILETVVPRAQAHVARGLDLSRPAQVAFAPNTHELVMRLLSCLEARNPLRILTTDAEFTSFARQAARLEELPRVLITRVPAEPFATFGSRFREAVAGGDHDLVYFSQVFYDSGFVVQDLQAIVGSVRSPAALVVIDGYHGWCAVPTSLRAIEDRAFYLAGGYKYAMSGEGVCFLHVPHGCKLRPVDTGWYALFGRLSDPPSGRVEYAEDAFRFWGATFDPTGLYRFNAVMEWMDGLGLSVESIHEHAKALQDRFLASLERRPIPALPARALVTPRTLDRQGNFLAFRLPTAAALGRRLHEANVDVDWRGDRLRFGFGIYQDEADVDALLERLSALEVEG
jgi:selenocysteine lyase/cysteine desulfurase